MVYDIKKVSRLCKDLGGEFVNGGTNNIECDFPNFEKSEAKDMKKVFWECAEAYKEE